MTPTDLLAKLETMDPEEPAMWCPRCWLISAGPKYRCSIGGGSNQSCTRPIVTGTIADCIAILKAWSVAHG